VKLLFDENLSPRLPAALASAFPTSTHVRAANLLGADDQQIWEYARAQGLIIVSKDTDFRERSFVSGHPPKVIWLDVGNAGTDKVAELLRENRDRIQRFEEQDESSFLILSLSSLSV
jgi:predicted nuclease of predicted toxin-antitoxin system